MPYCKKCGAELPEYAVFCSKCGVKYPVSAAPDDDIPAEPVQEAYEQSEAPVTPTEKQPKSTLNVTGWFKNYAMALYVILGVVTVALIQLSGSVVTLSTGFSITLAVFAIICSIAFLAVAIVKFVVCAHPIDGKKHSVGDIICLALGIIAFFYVLISAVAVIDAAKEVQDALDLLGSMQP
ncbi:MAG: zinc ribbon domain-containing protein [Clostridiales bacterium]|nr:zinc ribbon domain-containing protein [Clostridiales bacterium]